MNYDLEEQRVIELVKSNNAKKVCLQFADGLKKDSKKIYNKLKTICDIYLWGSTCFGSCDTPDILKNYNFDLIIQFGHSEWK